MKIFITGICGFVGSNLAEYYLNKKYKVSGCDNLIGGYLENINSKKIKFHKADCEKLEDMKKIIKNIDVVIHTAAYPHEGLSNFLLTRYVKVIFLALYQFLQLQFKIMLKELSFALLWQGMEKLNLHLVKIKSQNL